MDYEKALEFATIKHQGQTRKDGTSYILHPVRVAMRLKEYGTDYQIAGLFHDLLEDTDAKEDEILALSSKEVLHAVRLVTKRDDYDPEQYVLQILANPMAKAVKNADRIDNLSDAINASASFIRRYLKDTEKHYLGRFSQELDSAYSALKETVETFQYVINPSFGESTPIYRSTGDKAWEYDRQTARWIPADPFFWAEMGDDASPVSEKEAATLAGQII